MSKIKNSKIITLILCAILVTSIFVAFSTNATTVSAESANEGIAPLYAENETKYFDFDDGVRVTLDFVGKDILWPFADEVKVIMSSSLTAGITYNYKLNITQREGNQEITNEVAAVNGILGTGFNTLYLGQTFKVGNVSYKKWNVTKAYLTMTVTYKNVSKTESLQILFA